jgi:predicted metal-binding protein
VIIEELLQQECGMASLVQSKVSEEQLQRDLEKYRSRAVELGATDAKVISTEAIVLDERARAKCRFPTCKLYNTNVNCPPYTMPVREFREVVNGYSFKIDVTSGSFADFDRVNKSSVTDIVWRIESEAFYDGYYFAAGFGSTGCKNIFCPDTKCSVIGGGSCRYPWKARPGMHAVGFDVYRMAADAGWPLYPVGPSTDPAATPHMSCFGIVLVY